LTAPAQVTTGARVSIAFDLSTDTALAGVAAAIQFDPTILTDAVLEVNPTWSTAHGYHLFSLADSSAGLLLAPDLRPNSTPFLPGSNSIATLTFTTRPDATGTTEVTFPPSIEHTFRNPGQPPGDEGLITFRNVVSRDPNESLLNAETGSATLLVTNLVNAKLAIRPAADFRRGDANGSQQVDIADASFVLNYLFRAGPTPSCFDAADADDSGRLNITDPVVILRYLFLGGAELPPPGPSTPGPDPTPDALPCRE
jgi:hypothetical protein